MAERRHKLDPFDPSDKNPDFAYEKVYDIIENRLNRIGEIRSGEVFDTCKGRTHYGYVSIITAFREIMRTMVEQGKATQLKQGRWLIIKPNNPEIYKRPKPLSFL